jgi:hypothetical protein
MVWNLFLSSTVRDLKDYRLEVQDACVHKAETACLLSEEDWAGGYDDTVEKCRQRVCNANAFLLLAGYWYGSLPPDKDRSITHIEFDEAFRKWGQDKFPPMAVLMPEPGSHAAEELRGAAKAILEGSHAQIDVAAHEKALAAFHSALTGSWRTVTRFKDKHDLREHAIASCWVWKGRTPLAAARGDVRVEYGRSTTSQVTEEQLGQLGRSTHLSAVRAVLSRVTDHADVPAVAMLVQGDDDAGQRAFLQAVNGSAFKRYFPKQKLARLPLDHCDPSVLSSWIAQLLGVDGSSVQTPEQLAERIAPELKRQRMCFFIDRITDLAGGVPAFRDRFWLPLYGRLHALRATQHFSHRLVGVVADYCDDGAAWSSATCEASPSSGRPDYTALLRTPRLGPFERSDVLSWFDELEIHDEPAGRRAQLTTRALRNSRGEDDPVPTRVFERLKGEILWPEGAGE